MPEWRWSSLYQLKKRRQKARPSSIEPKRSGNSGRYLRVLNWASEYGLSLEQCGREWLLVTPRSASSSATVLEAMDVPRSAWIVSWSAATLCLRMVSAMKCSASSCGLTRGQQPAWDIAAVDVDDHVEVVVGPFLRTE